MIRRSNGNLHYLINGLDQGVAAKVPGGVYGVVELYGMTVKVTIVDRDEREEQNLITRRNTLHLQGLEGSTSFLHPQFESFVITFFSYYCSSIFCSLLHIFLSFFFVGTIWKFLRNRRFVNISLQRKFLLNFLPEVGDDEPLDRLTFHPCCGTHADVINNGRTAHRPK